MKLGASNKKETQISSCTSSCFPATADACWTRKSIARAHRLLRVQNASASLSLHRGVQTTERHRTAPETLGRGGRARKQQQPTFILKVVQPADLPSPSPTYRALRINETRFDRAVVVAVLLVISTKCCHRSHGENGRRTAVLSKEKRPSGQHSNDTKRARVSTV